MRLSARHAFPLVDRIGNDNAKREYYLTDIVALARGEALSCRVVELPADEVLGVNTRAELAQAAHARRVGIRRQRPLATQVGVRHT